MGYKEYAIHCGHEHSVVEVAMAKDKEHDMAMVREVLAGAREREGGQLDMPRVQVTLVMVVMVSGVNIGKIVVVSGVNIAMVEMFWDRWRRPTSVCCAMGRISRLAKTTRRPRPSASAGTRPSPPGSSHELPDSWKHPDP